MIHPTFGRPQRIRGAPIFWSERIVCDIPIVTASRRRINTHLKENPMQPIVIRYNTKPEGAQPNAQLIENVFVELERAHPANVRYLVLRLSDGVFIHIVAYDGEPEGLTGLPAFVRFQAE